MAEIRLTDTQSIVKSTPMGGNVGTDRYVFLIDIVSKNGARASVRNKVI